MLLKNWTGLTGGSSPRTGRTLVRVRSAWRMGSTAWMAIVRTGVARRLSWILQVCEIQCEPLVRGKPKLCLASIATEIRPTDNSTTQSFQVVRRRALPLKGDSISCSLGKFRSTLIRRLILPPGMPKKLEGRKRSDSEASGRTPTLTRGRVRTNHTSRCTSTAIRIASQPTPYLRARSSGPQRPKGRD